MWFAPPTLRQMFWMVWEEFKKDLKSPPKKTCPHCGKNL